MKAKIWNVHRATAAKLAAVCLVIWLCLVSLLAFYSFDDLVQCFSVLGIGCSVFLSGYLFWGRCFYDRILLDCGPWMQNRSRKDKISNAFVAVVLLLFGLQEIPTGRELSPASGLLSALYLLSAYSWMMLATERFLITERGIWLYGTLVRWQKIRAYEWGPGSTLILHGGTRDRWRTLQIPSNQKEDMQKLLDEYCPLPETKLELQSCP